MTNRFAPEPSGDITSSSHLRSDSDNRSERRVVVFGATGFVGSAVVTALRSKGLAVDAQSARRSLAECSPSAGLSAVDDVPSHTIEQLARTLHGAAAVINCAGVPDANSSDAPMLEAANGVLPGVIAKAVSEAGVTRFVHVSSAAVQGRVPTLGAGDAFPFSPYSRSKLMGEECVRRHAAAAAVVYRPATVHGAGRAVTERVVRLARSRLGSVAGPGTQPTPQALIENVADAVAFLALTEHPVPAFVSHPWEGLSCADLLRLLSGREPTLVPPVFARAITESAYRLGAVNPRLRVLARRVEMLWFGQAQEASWLTTAGWSPPARREAWARLGK